MIARFHAALRVAHYRLRSAWLRFYLPRAYPGIRCHRSVIFCRGTTVQAFASGRIDLGEGCVVQDYAVLIAEGGSMTIGPGCVIGRGSLIAARERVTIGAGTLIAEHVTIRDQDHAHQTDAPLSAQGMATAPVEIGHDVWLGAKVTVTKGVSIAPHAVVGANAVVTRTLGERGVYVGAPARPIARNSGAERHPVPRNPSI